MTTNDDMTPRQPDENEPLEQLFDDELDLVDETVARITDAEVNEYLRKVLSQSGYSGQLTISCGQFTGPWRKYNAERRVDAIALVGSMETVIAVRSATAEIIADAQLKAKAAADELRRSLEAIVDARQQTQEILETGRREAGQIITAARDEALNQATQMIRDAKEQAERILGDARSAAEQAAEMVRDAREQAEQTLSAARREAERIIATARNQRVHQTAWAGREDILKLWGHTPEVEQFITASETLSAEPAAFRLFNAHTETVKRYLIGYLTDRTRHDGFGPGQGDSMVPLWDVYAGDADMFPQAFYPKLMHNRGIDVAVRAVYQDARRPIVTASADDTVRVWDQAGSAAPRVLSGGGVVCAVAVRADGRTAVRGGGHGDRPVLVWDLAGSAAPRVLSGGGVVCAVVVRADGRTAVRGGGHGDRPVLVWDQAFGLGDFAAQRDRRLHSGGEITATRLAGWLARHGDIDGLRALADVGDHEAASRLAELLAQQGDLDGATQVLRALADVGDHEAAMRLAELLAQQGHGAEAARLRRFGLNPDGSIARA